jgi:hypothetical protein
MWTLPSLFLLLLLASEVAVQGETRTEAGDLLIARILDSWRSLRNWLWTELLLFYLNFNDNEVKINKYYSILLFLRTAYEFDTFKGKGGDLTSNLNRKS